MIAKYKNTKFKNMEELLEFAKHNNLTYYNGFNEDTEFAIFKSTPITTVTIKFDNIWECKLFESKIRNQCLKFIPRKYKPYGNSTILVSNELKNKLRDLKKEQEESYEMVLWRLIIKERGIT